MRAALVLFGAVLVACASAACSDDVPLRRPPLNPTADETPKGTRLATFGGGCFWCTDAVFRRVEGVISVEAGYAGGTTANPTYVDVCTGKTGHAEVVQVRYDPSVVPYERLLEVFWKTHDPTTKDRQGNDVGTQYRSVVFWHDEEQRRTAEDLEARLDAAKAFDAPIVTVIAPFDRFWKAEAYHQDYFAENPSQPYCRVVVGPKVAKFEKAFAEILKKRATERPTR